MILLVQVVMFWYCYPKNVLPGSPAYHCCIILLLIISIEIFRLWRLGFGDWLHHDKELISHLTSGFLISGGYRDALRFRPGEPITFDPDAFVVSRPTHMQSLLQKILQLQTFQQFVSDRLDLLNAGEGFKDEFDIEASLYSDRWGTQSRYKDWLSHMKVCFSLQVVNCLVL